MAFGVAAISRDGTVTYANLWLPKRWQLLKTTNSNIVISFDRFHVLRLYLFSALVVSSIFIIKKLAEVNLYDFSLIDKCCCQIRKFWGRARPWWERNDLRPQYL